jgi:hypothetical protein|eukprot:COSAG01_NODE_802_length_13465_cov_24.092242_5_plen_56_part_00
MPRSRCHSALLLPRRTRLAFVGYTSRLVFPFKPSSRGALATIHYEWNDGGSIVYV